MLALDPSPETLGTLDSVDTPDHLQTRPSKANPRPEKWRQELLHSFSNVADLTKHGLLTAEETKKLGQLGSRFEVRITPYYANLMSADPDCPIRSQALPHLGEEDPLLPAWATQLSHEIYGRANPWHHDPIGDITNLAAPRLTHRYQNRAILHLSTQCAVYCRFCFRKTHLNQNEQTLYEGSLEPALAYLKKTPGIRELILTGGDPLSLTDLALSRLFGRLAQIPHLRTVRIHSRMAVTLPFRFTPSLLDMLAQNWGFHLSVANHFNHPKELTPEARAALWALKKTGITLLNQSVLLKGVNASAAILSELFQELYECGVLPFYLHHPDWTPGTFHFRTSIEAGRHIYRQLRGLLPGGALRFRYPTRIWQSVCYGR
jgi:lysine 2,3-aminomutase